MAADPDIEDNGFACLMSCSQGANRLGSFVPDRLGFCGVSAPNRDRWYKTIGELTMRDRSPLLLARHLLDRRDFLSHLATGMGGIALSALLAQDGLLAAENDATPNTPAPKTATHPPVNPLAPKPPHFPAKAKRVLHIFCTGAVSHLDTWDYKPELWKRNGQPMPGAQKLITFQGEQGNLAQSPWKFKPRGQTGKYISELLPNLAECADDLCFIHSLTSKTNTHGPGEMFMSTGFTLEGFPSAGAWVSYALGTENQDLPAYVAIPDPRGDPQQGPANWANGFLPAVYQGTAFNASRPINHLDRPPEIAAGDDRAARDFLRLLNDEHLQQHSGDTELSARIAAYELAGRMQQSAPEVGDLSRESPATRASMAWTTPMRSWPRSAATACLPAGSSSGACGISPFSMVPSPWVREPSIGTGTGAFSLTTTITDRSSTSLWRRDIWWCVQDRNRQPARSRRLAACPGNPCRRLPLA